MKKTAFILLALVIMLFAITSVASAASSKSDYYSEIRGILDRLGAALDSGDRSAANSAFADLRASVYGLASLLTSLGEYNDHVQKITENASLAMEDAINWKTYLGFAYDELDKALGQSGGEPVRTAVYHS